MAYKATCPTLKKIADDEPMFVLRAQDESAPTTILAWIMLNPQLSDEKRKDAIECAEKMREWPNQKKAD